MRYESCPKETMQDSVLASRLYGNRQGHARAHARTHKTYIYLYIVFRQLDAIYIHVVFINEVFIHHVFKHHPTSVLCEQDTCTRRRSISERLFFGTRLELFCRCIIVKKAARFTNCGPRPDKATSPQLHNRNTKYVVRLMDHQLCIQMNISHSTQRNEVMKLNFMYLLLIHVFSSLYPEFASSDFRVYQWLTVTMMMRGEIMDCDMINWAVTTLLHIWHIQQ